jgi:hypothetical protein
MSSKGSLAVSFTLAACQGSDRGQFGLAWRRDDVIARSPLGRPTTLSLLGVCSLLRERGVEPADVSAIIGLDPGTLQDADNRIACSIAGQLLQRR